MASEPFFLDFCGSNQMSFLTVRQIGYKFFRSVLDLSVAFFGKNGMFEGITANSTTGKLVQFSNAFLIGPK